MRRESEIENNVHFPDGRGCGGRGVCRSAARVAEEEVAAAALVAEDFGLLIVATS